jgi:hypothetical protein
VDDKNAIVRAWYTSADNASDDATLVDLWLTGIDTAGLANARTVRLPQVFHVSGNRLFDTTCGKRSLPLLEPVEIERYR